MAPSTAWGAQGVVGVALLAQPARTKVVTTAPIAAIRSRITPHSPPFPSPRADHQGGWLGSSALALRSRTVPDPLPPSFPGGLTWCQGARLRHLQDGWAPNSRP